MSDELEDILKEAFAAEGEEKETIQADTEVSVDSDKPSEKVEGIPEAKQRDDKGRFTSKEEEKAEASAEAEEVTAPTLSKERAPSRWSPTIREKWAELPEDVRAEIIRCEEAGASGVRKLQEEMAPVKALVETLTPFMEEARQAGLDAGSYVQRTMAAERELRHADPARRFQAFLGIADTYGIPIRQYLQGQQQPPAQQPAIPPEIQRELQETKQWRQQQEEAAIRNEITTFSNGKEFFEDVRVAMGNLMEAGVAKTLSDAYDQACWMNPEIRKVLQQREKSGSNQEAIRQRQEAAQKVNLKSTSNLDVETKAEDPDDLDGIIRQQFAKHGRS